MQDLLFTWLWHDTPGTTVNARAARLKCWQMAPVYLGGGGRPTATRLNSDIFTCSDMRSRPLRSLYWPCSWKLPSDPNLANLGKTCSILQALARWGQDITRKSCLAKIYGKLFSVETCCSKCWHDLNKKNKILSRKCKTLTRNDRILTNDNILTRNDKVLTRISNLVQSHQQIMTPTFVKHLSLSEK